MIISAYATSTLGNGHIWVIDGCLDYSYRHITTETYYCVHPDMVSLYSNVVAIYTYDEMMNINPDAYNGMQSVTSTNHTLKSLHMNWGYDGDSDGYYSLLSSDDWICQNGNVPLNYLYDRHMHYNISTSQLN